MYNNDSVASEIKEFTKASIYKTEEKGSIILILNKHSWLSFNFVEICILNSRYPGILSFSDARVRDDAHNNNTNNNNNNLLIYMLNSTARDQLQSQHEYNHENKNKQTSKNKLNPCGGGVEYLHREPASRKRRRNGTKKGRATA
jgi:hypothetical protein